MKAKKNFRSLLLGGEGSLPEAPEGLLNKLQMSVEELANAAGVTRTSLYYYLGGKKNPSEQTLDRICSVLGITREQGREYCTPTEIGRPAQRQKV